MDSYNSQLNAALFSDTIRKNGEIIDEVAKKNI